VEQPDGLLTYRHMVAVSFGEDLQVSVLVPTGVVHAFQNLGSEPGVSLNLPNQLYKG
jgi:dTDP-4-dehydrorhamnose 3,5-epimerase